MKFKFDDKDKEDSFLKTRTDSLSLPEEIKDRITRKGIRTLRGLIYQTNKELNKTTGSAANTALLMSELDKLALEVQLTESLKTFIEEKNENPELEQMELPPLPDFIFDADDDIIGTFAAYFGIDRKDIVSGGRRQDLVHIRDLIVCILREYADMSFPAIGRLLGGRDHTTIIHSYKKLKDRFKSDEKLRSGLNELITKAQAIKDRKTHIAETLIPDLIASIREKQLRQSAPLKVVEISDRNMKVLELYREGLTLEELGKASGVTRERARQIVERTIRQMAQNESITKGIELDADIIVEEEKKKRVAIKNKGRIAKVKPIREKTWSRYYMACKSCGTTAIPHRRHGLCQKCTGQYGEEMRDAIIARHSEMCDTCHISRSDGMREYGRDFYITKDQRVLCRKCFLSRTGRIIGRRNRTKKEV